MKKNDIILIIILIVLAGGIYLGYRFFYREAGGKVVITVDGKEYMTLSLMDDSIIEIPGAQGINTLEIKNGKADMIAADCTDLICVNHKAIQYNGERIVCLPNKIIVKITEGESSQLDGVVQ